MAKNDIRFIWASGQTLYGRPTADSATTVGLSETGDGIYTADDDNPFIYQQVGGSPDVDDDLFVGQAREFFYGSEAEGNGFFASRLHSWDWDNASTRSRLKALSHATMLIDKFCYLGDKATTAQRLEFPRGDDTAAPAPIRQATYLIADALLSGRVPAADFEQLVVKVETFGPVRTEYERTRAVQEHLANLVPSPDAWALIRPYLRIPTTFTTRRS